MSNFHASIRDILEETYWFLSTSLQNEVLSTTNLTYKEKLLSRLKNLRSEYPELQLQLCSLEETKSDSTRFSTSSSPLPYVDMNGGGSPYKMSFSSSNDKENYDVVIPKDRCDVLENQSIAESEDYTSDDAKYLPDVAASDLYSCEKSGYLDKKKRESIKGWLNPFQKRWCAIKDGVLYYFEKTTDRKQRGNIILGGYEARTLLEDKDGKKYNHCFELVCPGKRTYQFSAASEKDLQQWISAVERNNSSFNLGKISSRESQSFSSSPKNVERDAGHHIPEDIYETVDEDDLEKQNANVLLSQNPPAENEEKTLLVFEESTPEQIFNYSEWYVGLWDCSASDDSELSFYRGDLIHVISKEYDGYAWWIGELQGKVGFVPKSYLMEAYESY